MVVTRTRNERTYVNDTRNRSRCTPDWVESTQSEAVMSVVGCDLIQTRLNPPIDDVKNDLMTLSVVGAHPDG